MKILLCSLILALAAACAFGQIATITETPAVTDAPLFNPGMGATFMPALDQKMTGEWYDKLFSTAYFRLDWCDLEPGEGKFRFDEVFGKPFNYWKSAGRSVAFRVISSNMNSGATYVTPKWVFDAGVPGVEHKSVTGARQLDPAFWNDTYLRKQIDFIKAVGKKYNGMKGLAFVDIGSIGEWGESHLNRWTSEDKQKAAYSRDAYTSAYVKIIDAYKSAFPDTPVVLSCDTGGEGQNDVIVDYAVSKGVLLRQDGLTADYNSIATRYYSKYYGRVPLIYEFGGSVGNNTRATVDRGFRDRISYLNAGWTSDLKTLPQSGREAFIYAAKSIGYRFVPVRVVKPAQVELYKDAPNIAWVTVTWANKGIAPCFRSYQMETSLWSQGRKLVCSAVQWPESPTTQWAPGSECQTTLTISLPGDVKPGTYDVRVALVNPQDPADRLMLPLTDVDGSRRGKLTTLTLTASAAASSAPVIPGLDFGSASAMKDWYIARGIRTVPNGEPGPSGKPSVRVEGQSTDGWAYVATPRIRLVPGFSYRLSGWLKVLQVDSTSAVPGASASKPWDKAPAFKVGLSDPGGAFRGNIFTPRYDASKMGTWQKLECTLVPETSATTGFITVEKFTNGPRSATLFVSDVRLERLSRVGK